METIKLKHFCAVVETKSLTRAAKQLGISHPGIHKSLKSLEVELGIKLTIPDGRGISITPIGMALYEKAKEVLSKTDELTNFLRSEVSDSIKLGFSEIFNFSLPNTILEYFENKYSISFHERCPGELEPQVASGYLDYGIGTFPMNHSGVSHSLIAEVEYSLYSNRESKLTNDLTFIIPHSNFNTKKRDHWDEVVFQRKKTIKTNMLSIGLNLACEGKGVIFIPTFLAESVNSKLIPSKGLQKVIIPNEIKTSVPIYFIQRIGEKKKTIESELISLIRKHIA